MLHRLFLHASRCRRISTTSRRWRSDRWNSNNMIATSSYSCAYSRSTRCTSESKAHERYGCTVSKVSRAQRRFCQNCSGLLRYNVSIMNEVTVDDCGDGGCWSLSAINFGAGEDFCVGCRIAANGCDSSLKMAETESNQIIPLHAVKSFFQG